MTEATFGRVTARGDQPFIDLVKLSLDECKNLPNGERLEDKLGRDFVIEEHTPKEFLKAGAIIPGSIRPWRPRGIPAEGHVMSGGELWINSQVADNKPPRARHICRHEIDHVLPLSNAKRRDLMLLMWTEDGKHPKKWNGGGYEGRPSECFADQLAVAMSGKGSPWDDFAYFDLDVKAEDFAKMIEIAFRVEVPPPVPEPQPPVIDPIPLPPEPEYVVALRLQLEDREARLGRIKLEATY